MPEIKAGSDLLCLDSGPYKVSREDTGLKQYAIYRVVFKELDCVGLEGLPHTQTTDGAVGTARFIDVSDWPEEEKALNRA